MEVEVVEVEVEVVEILKEKMVNTGGMAETEILALLAITNLRE